MLSASTSSNGLNNLGSGTLSASPTQWGGGHDSVRFNKKALFVILTYTMGFSEHNYYTEVFTPGMTNEFNFDWTVSLSSDGKTLSLSVVEESTSMSYVAIG